MLVGVLTEVRDIYQDKEKSEELLKSLDTKTKKYAATYGVKKAAKS